MSAAAKTRWERRQERMERHRLRSAAFREQKRKEKELATPQPLERYRKMFRMPVMPEDSKPSWAAEGVGDRRLWCRRYDACLSYAACLKWPGFDCGSCSVREEEPPTARVLEGIHVSRQDDIREVWAAIRRRN